MVKILTYINFAIFLLGAAGLGAYIYRSKIFDAVMSEVQKEIPAMVEGLLPAMPKSTGINMPF
jgi:argonaute-like protein implicated in RNA metabolism and viral defense